MPSSSDYGEAEYLCYQVLEQMDQKSDKDIYETEFNKLCYMAYYDLANEGVELDLPVYWYQWGGVVEAPSHRYPVKYETRGDSTLVRAKETSEAAFDVASDARKRIIQKARSLADRYKNTYGTDSIKDDSYEEFAPNEFIKTFNSLRSTIDGLESEQAALSDFTDSGDEKMGSLRPEMDALVQQYPSDEYTEMESAFRQWDSITRQLAKNNQVTEIKEFTRRFWVAISRVELRLVHNENIPPSRLSDWLSERESERTKFEDTITEYRTLALEERKSTSNLESVAESYSETVRRMARDLVKN
jgi:hypothetical protein